MRFMVEGTDASIFVNFVLVLPMVGWALRAPNQMQRALRSDIDIGILQCNAKDITVDRADMSSPVRMLFLKRKLG